MNNVYKVFGAPGCGKTTRLMEILERELKTVDPSEIAFVSFTRKGTYEGAERARELFGYKEADLPYFRTLHSIAFRSGELSKTDMMSKKDYRTFSEAMDMKFTGYYTEEFYNNDDRYLFMHFLRRNNQRMFMTYVNSVDQRILRVVEHNFARYKAYARVYDFTDIIERFIEVDQALPVKVAIIDEAQDLTTLQWKMCEVAFRDCERVYIAGDDDQAIYEWSGADVDYFLDIKAEQEVLGKSWRLRRQVLEQAREVSAMIRRRVNKEFEPVDEGGEVITHNSIDDVPIVKGETYYFLSRNNWFLSALRENLRKRAKVFMDRGVSSVDTRHISAINALERARRRGHLTDQEDVKLRLYVDKVDLKRPWFEQIKLENDVIKYYRDLIRLKVNLDEHSITLSTIHGVKGGEADNVVLLLDFTRAVNANMYTNPDSELRCLYVACTRAKRRLHIVHSTSKTGYDSFINFNGGKQWTSTESAH